MYQTLILSLGAVFVASLFYFSVTAQRHATGDASFVKKSQAVQSTTTPMLDADGILIEDAPAE